MQRKKKVHELLLTEQNEREAGKLRRREYTQKNDLKNIRMEREKE
jgi:hypothetical protein